MLDHVTDAYLEAWGQTIEAAFSSAAEALFDTMLNLTQVQPRLADEVNVEGHDEMELLYNWLEALLLKFEIGNVAYSRFQVDPIVRSRTSVTLHARILGEKYNREKHGSKHELKVFPGTEHGFAFNERAGYNTLASEETWDKMFALWERTLK